MSLIKAGKDIQYIINNTRTPMPNRLKVIFKNCRLRADLMYCLLPSTDLSKFVNTYNKVSTRETVIMLAFAIGGEIQKSARGDYFGFHSCEF